MTDFEPFTFEKPKLFAFYIGGKIEKCNIEMHDVIFTAGKTDKEVLEIVKNKCANVFSSFHIDSWAIIENIEGYEVSIQTSKSKSENKLFFVNLGSYLKNKFGENHFMGFYVAKSRAESIDKAKATVPQNEELIHGDNIYNLDDCINLEEVDNFYINLNFTGEIKKIQSTNGYIKVK